MKGLDAVLLSIVFVVWGALALMYATIPMIQMPTSFRVWGLGALLFLVLAAVTAVAERIGRRRRASDKASDKATEQDNRSAEDRAT